MKTYTFTEEQLRAFLGELFPNWDDEDVGCVRARLLVRKTCTVKNDPPPGKTVRVRIAVATTDLGSWDAVGGAHLEDHEASAHAVSDFEQEGGVRLSWVEADVPLPEEVTVQGKTVTRRPCPECGGTGSVQNDSGGNIGITAHCLACHSTGEITSG